MKKTLLVFILALAFVPSFVFAAGTTKQGASNNGLVGWWKFDENTGTKTTDGSGKGNSGTLSNSPSWSTGKLGKALSFNGTTQYVSKTTPSGFSTGTSPRSIAGWINLSSASAVAVPFVYGTCGTGNDGKAFGIYIDASAIIHFWGCGTGDYSTGISMTLNTWHYIVVTYDGTNVQVYLDSATAGAATPRTLLSSTAFWQVGAASLLDPGNYYFPGKIDDVRVYTRALSASEVSALYQAGTTKIGVQQQQGLSGAYYDGVNFNTYVNTHTDSTINFDPADSLGVSYANSSDGDTFSVRWTGYVKAPYTGTYTFYTTSDDGTRLYVNNTLVVDSWIDQGPTEHSGTINLVAGQWYPIRLDFYENGGGAVITLSWSQTSIVKQIVPSANLEPTAVGGHVNSSSTSRTTGSTLLSGLVGLWSFDGGKLTTTTSTDQSGSGNDGTLTNGPTPTIGKMGQGLIFNGTNQYVLVPNNSSFNTTTITVAAWEKIAAGGSWKKMVGRGPDATEIFGLYKNPSGQFDVEREINNTQRSTVLISSGRIDDNTWHHVVYEYDGSTESIYVDGVQLASASISGTLNTNAENLAIGAEKSSSTAAYFWSGALDDVRVYNRALSAAEIKQLYLLGK